MISLFITLVQKSGDLLSRLTLILIIFYLETAPCPCRQEFFLISCTLWKIDSEINFEPDFT